MAKWKPIAIALGGVVGVIVGQSLSPEQQTGVEHWLTLILEIGGAVLAGVGATLFGLRGKQPPPGPPVG